MQSIHIRVPENAHETIRDEAHQSRRSMNRVIVDDLTRIHSAREQALTDRDVDARLKALGLG